MLLKTAAAGDLLKLHVAPDRLHFFDPVRGTAAAWLSGESGRRAGGIPAGLTCRHALQARGFAPRTTQGVGYTRPWNRGFDSGCAN